MRNTGLVSVGQVIRVVRRALDLVPLTVANEAGIPVTFLEALECGDRDPTIDHLGRLAKTFGIPFEVFVASEQMRLGRPCAFSCEQSSDILAAVYDIVDLEGRIRKSLGGTE